jgi:hypothetical protein
MQFRGMILVYFAHNMKHPLCGTMPIFLTFCTPCVLYNYHSTLRTCGRLLRTAFSETFSLCALLHSTYNTLSRTDRAQQCHSTRITTLSRTDRTEQCHSTRITTLSRTDRTEQCHSTRITTLSRTDRAEQCHSTRITTLSRTDRAEQCHSTRITSYYVMFQEWARMYYSV